MCIPFPRKLEIVLAAVLVVCGTGAEDGAAQAVIVSPNIVRDARYTLRAYVNGHPVNDELVLHEGVNTIRRNYDSLTGGTVTVIHEVELDTVPPDIKITDVPMRSAADSVVVKGTIDGLPFTQTHPFDGEPGERTIAVRAVDRAGNASEISLRVVKDPKKKPPKILPLPFKPQTAVPEPVPPSGPRVLTGDYALIIEMTDSAGRSSFQMLKAGDGVQRVPVIFRGVIKKIVYVYYRVVQRETPAGAAEKVKAVFAVYDAKKPAPPLLEIRGGALFSGEGPAPAAHPDGATPALVKLETLAGTVAHGMQAATIGTVEAPVRRATTGTHADAKREEKQFATGNREGGDAGPEPYAAASEESPAAPVPEKTRGLSYTQTHVRIPDEYGGMTITLDNYKTGERTVIRKDQGGNETGRVVTKFAEPEKKNTARPEAAVSPK